MLPPRDPAQIEKYTQTKTEVMEKKIFHANVQGKKLRQQYLYPTKQTLKPRLQLETKKNTT